MDIASIKSRLSILTVLSYYGLAPDKNNRLLCPFHHDTTPSLQVYPEKNRFTCFSTKCTAGNGDVIDFIRLREKLTAHGAIKRAGELAGQGSGEEPGSSVAAPAASAYSEAERSSYLTKVFGYFLNAVSSSKPAQAYVQGRGLDTRRLPIGYNSGQFHHRENKSVIDEAVAYGLLKPNPGGGYFVFGKRCLVFALKDREDRIVSLYFRSISDKKGERHFYLKDRQGLYPGYPKPETKRLILTESIIDAATLLQIPEVVKEYTVLACYGTEGVKEQFTAIGQLEKIEEIVFFFDGDASGREAVKKHSEELLELRPTLQYSVVETPEGEDINSLRQGHDTAIFTHLLNNRTFLFSQETTPPEPTRDATGDAVSCESENVSGVSCGLDDSNPHKLRYSTATAHYAILGGLAKSYESLKVTLEVASPSGGRKSRNKVDLYDDRQITRLCTEVCERLGLRSDQVAADLYRLADLLQAHRERREAPSARAPQPAALTARERTAAESFLKKKHVLRGLSELLGRAGIVGEERARVFLYLVALSHKFGEPLHALIQGTSGSGKTRLLKHISESMPPERVTRLTRLTDKVLYNYPETYFVNRLLCLEDIDGLSEEAEFALRELQSNGELVSASSVKLDDGRISSGEKRVRGPIASLACTTRGEVYEDNLSRSFLVAVDESAAQTARVIAYQNDKAAGRIDGRVEASARRFLQNVARALEPLEVVNPYAGALTLPEEAHKIRRLNELLQSFIKMTTAVNQYQRRTDAQGRLVATVEDVREAVEIMFESIVLKVDELDGSLRHFFEDLKGYVSERGRDYEFTRFEVREATGVGKTQQHHYIGRLVELEYLRQYGYPNRGYRYRVAHWDDYQGLRRRIQGRLQEQLAGIAARENGVGVRKGRTPERTPEAP